MMKETLLATTLTAAVCAAEPMQWTQEELFAVPQTFADTGLEKYRAEGVQSFLLEGPRTSDGKTTKAYAYYALPSEKPPERSCQESFSTGRLGRATSVAGS